MKDLAEYFRLGPAERMHEAADFMGDDEDDEDAGATVRNELKRHGVFFNEDEDMADVDTFAIPEGAVVPDDAFDYDLDLPDDDEAWDAFWDEWGEDLPEEW